MEGARFRGLMLCALLLVGMNSGVEAQQLAPVAFSVVGFSAVNRPETPYTSPPGMPHERASRGEHVVLGAMAGALVGSVALVLVNSHDRTGEGLSDSTMFVGGALIGALLGAIVAAAVFASHGN